MITPELLQQYTFFNGLSKNQLKAIAEISETKVFDPETVIFQEGKPAEALYLLLEGGIDLYYAVEVEYRPELNKELHFDKIEPGEVFGISTLIEPHTLTSSARTTQPCKMIKIGAEPLLNLCKKDTDLALNTMRRVATALKKRISSNRLELAKAWAKT